MKCFPPPFKGKLQSCQPKVTIMLLGKILCGMKFHTKCYEVNKIILKNSTWAWKAISACLSDSCKIQPRFIWSEFFLWALRFLTARTTITPVASLVYHLLVGKIPGDHLGFFSTTSNIATSFLIFPGNQEEGSVPRGAPQRTSCAQSRAMLWCAHRYLVNHNQMCL